MGEVKKPKAKKTWQGVTGFIFLMITVVIILCSIIQTKDKIPVLEHAFGSGMAGIMFIAAIVLGIVGIGLIVKGSNVKDNFIVSGDLILTYKWENIFLKVDGYEEDEWDVNKGKEPLEVLIDYDNKRPIVYKIEDNIVHFEQCMIIYCTVNDVKRVYAVLHPIEYQVLGFEEHRIILAYVEAGDDELYLEDDENFQKEFFNIFEAKYETFIKDLEKKSSEKQGGNDLLDAVKGFGKIMGGIFSDALHLNDGSSSSSGDSDEIIVNEGAYERKLKHQYFDYDKHVHVYRDQMGCTWYSEDQQHFYKE